MSLATDWDLYGSTCIDRERYLTLLLAKLASNEVQIKSLRDELSRALSLNTNLKATTLDFPCGCKATVGETRLLEHSTDCVPRQPSRSGKKRTSG